MKKRTMIILGLVVTFFVMLMIQLSTGLFTSTTTTTSTSTLTTSSVEQSIVISFNSNGGDEVESLTQQVGTEVYAPIDPTKTGYTFGGWYTDDITFTTPYVFSIMPSSNIVLSAKWTINQYVIEYVDHDGSILLTLNYDYGADLSGITPPSSPSRTGYTFASWDGTLPTTMGTQKVTLTATYTINQYAVEYVDHDGSILQTANYDYGADLSGITPPSSPSRTGYTFASWDGTLPTTMGTQNVTFTATYTVNQYTISFNTLGGNSIDPLIGLTGDLVTAPENPSREGYAFTGWFTDATLTTLYTISVFPSMDLTVYAGWYSTTLSFTLIDDGTHYSVSRGTATGDIIIPSTYLGLPVTMIAINGFDRFGQSWNFTSISIPEGITTIGMDAFRSLTWTSVTLPSTLVSLGSGVFSFNSSLLTVHIPENVSSIGLQAFSSAMDLTSITVDSENDWFASQDGVLYSRDMTKLISFPPASPLTNYTVPSSVTTLETYSIRQVKYLQYLVLQNGLTTINANAITSCSALLSVIIPLNVTTIANSAIVVCNFLTIYTEEASKPAGWGDSWNSSNRPVIWNYVVE